MEVSVERNLSAPQPMDVESSPLFIIDTQPGPVPSTLPHQTPKHEAPSDDEEVIVYIAPHPKQRRSPPSTTTTITTRNDTPIGQAPDAGDTSAFEPYIPPSTLALASISIQGEASAAPIPELHPTQDEQPSKTETVSLPETASTPAPAPTTPLPHPTVESLKLGLISALNQEVSRTSIPGTRKLPSAMSPRMTKQQKAWERKKAKREREGKKRKGRRGSSGHLAAYGALVSEARLEDVWVEGRGKGEDPRWEERRRGDSDLEWGTEDEGEREDGGEEEVEEGALVVGKSEKAKGKQRARDVEGVEEDHGMEVDEIDVSAMKQFVSSLVGETAGEYVTMDDIEAEKQIRAEDEEGLGGAEGSSDEDEVEGVLKLEEKLFIGESDDEESEEDEEDEEDDSEDDEAFVSPKSSFQARLEKLRKKSREKRPANGSDEEDDDMLARNLAWDEEDDEYDEDISLIDHVQVSGLHIICLCPIFIIITTGDASERSHPGSK
ncbi:hypothetical protein P691DRAFT_85987 [Macrolepiota fuliginosa MF-IS2]|uniref:Uncharacterized protein n=1 Tax=Macrolepiota fuliginosa MF-IS2 TaxID=1400762 RepID=A0A9P6C445_9AGAR|nr:hypothetical protein P691DRAFT_85987 [Macrolepiota fuliginosa MF-IS2]